MGFRTSSAGGLFVIHWHGQLTAQDQSDGVAALRAHCEARKDKPVLLVFLGEDLQPPGPDVRRAGLTQLRAALELVVAIEIVVSARGLLATLQRTTARGLALLSPELRGRLHVHEAVAPAVAHASTLLPLDVEGLVRRLTREGLTAS